MTTSFIMTKEHRRFTEFADAVKMQRTIGICFGPAGVGKTPSARRYAHWDAVGPFIDRWGARKDSDEKINAAANRTRTVFYTPHVATTQKTLEQELNGIIIRTERCVEEHLTARGHVFDHTGQTPWAHFIELVIIDEAERLSATALELLRDRYDRTNVALILIGMPGIDKQFSHYPQLYSRLGFAHQYRALGQDELQFVLERHWRKLGKHSNSTTSPTHKPSPLSNAPPAATSDSSNDSSPKSNASSRSTTSTSSPTTSSKQPEALSSSAQPDPATTQQQNPANQQLQPQNSAWVAHAVIAFNLARATRRRRLTPPRPRTLGHHPDPPDQRARPDRVLRATPHPAPAPSMALGRGLDHARRGRHRTTHPSHLLTTPPNGPHQGPTVEEPDTPASHTCPHPAATTTTPKQSPKNQRR